MDLILEWDDIVKMLREHLHNKGIVLDTFVVVRARSNHKKDTIRIVFQEKPLTKSEP